MYFYIHILKLAETYCSYIVWSISSLIPKYTGNCENNIYQVVWNASLTLYTIAIYTWVFYLTIVFHQSDYQGNILS